MTKAAQVEEAVKTAAISLTEQEVMELETLADEANVSTIRGWEKEMK